MYQDIHIIIDKHTVEYYNMFVEKLPVSTASAGIFTGK